MSKHVFKVKIPPNGDPVANAGQLSRYAAGIDVHKYNLVACVAVCQGMHEGITMVSLQEFKTNPKALGAMVRFLAKYPLQAVVMEATGVYSNPVKVALEQYDGWPSRPLILTFNPTEVKHFPGEIHEDKADAFAMARYALMGVLRASFIPQGAIKELRAITREVGVMIKESTRAKERVKRVLDGWGLALPTLDLSCEWALDLFRALDWAGGDFGKAMKGIDGGEFPVSSITRQALERRKTTYAPFESVVIPPSAHTVLRGYLLSLAASGAKIGRLAGEVESILEANAALGSAVNQVATIDGIQFFTAASIVAEVGDISRFKSVKHFLSYAGCAPTIHRSGTLITKGRMTRRANQYLKQKFFWIGKEIVTVVKAPSDIMSYAKDQRKRHPDKSESKLVWAKIGAKVARVVFAILRAGHPYGAFLAKTSESTQKASVKSQKSLKDLRKQSRRFVNFLNRFQADAPAKFQVVADAFQKLTWA
jgi:transposase